MAFLAAFAVYWFTLGPTVWVGDSGELIAAAHLMGIPHPTGYPLWLLLTKAFTAIVPFGPSVAWRANLFSALCAALAAEVLSRALRRLGAGRLAAFSGGLALAFLGPIWGEATVARTYPLAALFSASLLWCTARFVASPCGRWLVGHNLLLGFGLANHLMVIAHAPALLAVVAGREPARLAKPKLWAAALLALVPGLLLYLYLPWRAAASPALEYRVQVEADGRKSIHELTDLAGVRAYLAREPLQSHAWAGSSGNLVGDQVTIVAHHLIELARELTPLGVVFALFGAWNLWRSGRRSLVVAIALLWLGTLAPLALHGAWWDVFLYPRYMTTGFVGVALLVGMGIDAAVRWVAARMQRGAEAPSPAARAVAAVVALALPVALLAVNWRACDRRDGWLAEDYGRALLAELPPDSEFLCASDRALYPLFTLRFVEGARPDVTLVSPQQLPGEGELLPAWRAMKRGAPAPAQLPPAFTLGGEPPDRFEGLLPDRRGLLCRLKRPDAPDLPREPYAPPKIRGLERDDEPDPFARSVIGAIEADLADAAAVRGDRAQALQRLQRVLRLRCPRPWGNALGLETLLTIAKSDAAAKQAALMREDLELARDLARAALRDGDPRDPYFNERLTQLERALKAD